MTVYVERVSIPAMSTIGFGYGRDENGCEVTFYGDHRPMRELGEALIEAGEPIPAEPYYSF